MYSATMFVYPIGGNSSQPGKARNLVEDKSTN